MVKTKFYRKSITLVNANRSVTFVFRRTDQKKEEYLRGILGHQILSRYFPNNRYFLQYLLDIKIVYVCYGRNISFNLPENC